MAISKSQYPGTTKDTVCTKCGMNLNHLNRLEQDKHESECSKQDSLDKWDFNKSVIESEKDDQ